MILYSRTKICTPIFIVHLIDSRTLFIFLFYNFFLIEKWCQYHFKGYQSIRCFLLNTSISNNWRKCCFVFPYLYLSCLLEHWLLRNVRRLVQPNASRNVPRAEYALLMKSIVVRVCQFHLIFATPLEFVSLTNVNVRYIYHLFSNFQVLH